MSIPQKVRGIGISKHETTQFAKLFLFFSGKNNKGQKVYTSFKCKLYLVEGFRANILIENNILAPKKFIFNIKLGHAVIRSCGVKITIWARQKDQLLRKKLLFESNRVISLRSKAIILLLQVFFPDNRNFLFYLVTQTNLTLFAHIIDHETIKVLVKNTFNQLLYILRRQKLGQIVDICYNNYFFANAKSALHSATFPLKTLPFFEHELSCTPKPTDLSIKTRLDNGV